MKNSKITLSLQTCHPSNTEKYLRSHSLANDKSVERLWKFHLTGCKSSDQKFKGRGTLQYTAELLSSWFISFQIVAKCILISFFELINVEPKQNQLLVDHWCLRKIFLLTLLIEEYRYNLDSYPPSLVVLILCIYIFVLHWQQLFGKPYFPKWAGILSVTLPACGKEDVWEISDLLE